MQVYSNDGTVCHQCPTDARINYVSVNRPHLLLTKLYAIIGSPLVSTVQNIP